MVEGRVVLVGESENEDWVCKNNKTGSGVQNISLEKGGGGGGGVKGGAVRNVFLRK